jgi:hypothetical protein
VDRRRLGRTTALLLLLAAAARADPGLLPSRRRDQFSSEPGRALVPYAYHLPGIGWGYGVLGALTNVGHTPADVAGTLFFGDADGQALSVDGLPLVRRRLILDAGAAHISKVSLQSYAARGMGAGKDDYSLAQFSGVWFYGSRMTATYDERRFEGFAGWYGGTARLDALRDRAGKLLLASGSAPRYDVSVAILGLRADLTDDYIDPRRGLRLEPSVWRAPRRGSGPDFFFMDYLATAYLPVGSRSTWAFHLFRSDAHVLHAGQTDTAVLAREQGLDCAAVPDAAGRDECERYLDTLAAQNAHGTATMLGGFNRLRAYPEGRFKGAHSEMAGTELRWNLTDEEAPFDIYVLKDIRTAVQLALFYEAGSVADTRGELWKAWRSAYGAGARVVTASGLVYRLDLGAGDEGIQPSIFFQYPWEL